MRATCRLACVTMLATVAAIGGVATSAAALPITIGEFQWNDDGTGLGPALRLLNFSNDPQFGEVPENWSGAAFTDLTLRLDGVESTLSFLDAGTVATPGLWEVFASPGVQSAEVSFAFLTRPFVLTLQAQDLTLVAADPFGFGDALEGTRLVDYELAEQAPIPEPGTLLLLGTGLAALLWRRPARRPFGNRASQK